MIGVLRPEREVLLERGALVLEHARVLLVARLQDVGELLAQGRHDLGVELLAGAILDVDGGLGLGVSRG